MKKKSFGFLLWFMFISMILLIAAIILLNLIFQDKDDWLKLLFDLMGDLLSAIIIGLFLGLVTKIITNRLFSVQINMKKMRDFGIEGIGSGISTLSDIRNMFGYDLPKKKYPLQLKLLFLTGNGFLRIFKNELVKCLDEGCEIQLLIVSPEKENEEYLKRCSYRYHNDEVDYVKEVREDSLKSVEEIKKKSKHPENFKVRFYMDEYQNNIRISKYHPTNDKILSYYWINLQPLTKPAKDLSIALKGSTCYDLKNDVDFDKNNLCIVAEEGFDLLWKKYEATEK